MIPFTDTRIWVRWISPNPWLSSAAMLVSLHRGTVLLWAQRLCQHANCSGCQLALYTDTRKVVKKPHQKHYNSSDISGDSVEWQGFNMSRVSPHATGRLWVCVCALPSLPAGRWSVHVPSLPPGTVVGVPNTFLLSWWEAELEPWLLTLQMLILFTACWRSRRTKPNTALFCWQRRQSGL